MFVAAFWLLATQHCGLEAAGVFETHGEVAQGCCPSENDEHCSRDGCELVEGRGVNLSSSVKVLQPQLALCPCVMDPVVIVPEPETAPHVRADEFGRPMEWVPAWQFVQRAALSPRAPSVVLA